MIKKFDDINIIAEVGTAHEGSFALACSYIYSAKKSGADAVKFQTHISYAESSKFDQFRVKSRFIDDKSRKKFWDRTSFTLTQYHKLKNLTERLGMFFLSSPFSMQAVDLLQTIKIKAWKIGSGELTNLPLIDKVAKTNKPMIISTGLSDINEIKETIKIIKKYHSKIVIMQCTSLYPCPDEKIGFNVINDLKNIFPYKIGFSDHSGDPAVPLAAYSIGSEILEVHVTFDKDIKTFDSSSSLNFKELKFLSDSVKKISKIKNSNVDKFKIPNYLKKNKILFEKGIYLKNNMQKGDKVQISNLEFKKPMIGIHSKKYKKILGKKIKKNLHKGTFLKESDF